MQYTEEQIIRANQTRSCIFSERTGGTVGEKWQGISLEKA